METKALEKIISEHKKWLNNNKIGSRADLSGADLSGADLSGSDLSWADLSWANLSGANLSGANLSRSNLSRADLSRADLDFSCIPLWCGGAHFKADRKIVHQLLAHICTIEIVDIDDAMAVAIESIRSEAFKSHRANELNIINPLPAKDA